MKARRLPFTDEDQFGDYCDWQVRIGYHPGVRVYVPRHRRHRRPPPLRTGAAGEPSPNREGAVQSVHRRSREELDAHGKRQGS